ncbi:MAG: FAD-dependent oxidoreductase [Candidatus Levyibacteriota bacterium]
MNQTSQYVFLASGIGVTPFRSIIKHHLEHKKKLNATLFYFSGLQEELLFRDIFKNAVTQIGMTFIPVLSGTHDTTWTGLTGRFSEEMLKEYIVDLHKPTYYISGSETFINTVREELLSLTISEEQIKTDIFSGY